MITDYTFNEPNSPGAKNKIDFLDEKKNLISMLQQKQVLEIQIIKDFMIIGEDCVLPGFTFFPTGQMKYARD